MSVRQGAVHLLDRRQQDSRDSASSLQACTLSRAVSTCLGCYLRSSSERIRYSKAPTASPSTPCSPTSSINRQASATGADQQIPPGTYWHQLRQSRAAVPGSSTHLPAMTSRQVSYQHARHGRRPPGAWGRHAPISPPSSISSGRRARTISTESTAQPSHYQRVPYSRMGERHRQDFSPPRRRHRCRQLLPSDSSSHSLHEV